MRKGLQSDQAAKPGEPNPARERLDEEILEARITAGDIVESIHDPLIVLTPDLRVRVVNPAFYEQFRVSPEETTGRLIYELGNGQWDIPDLHTLLEEILPENDSFVGYEVAHEFKDIGWRVMLLNARRLDHLQLILLVIADVTDRKQVQALGAAKEEAQRNARRLGQTLNAFEDAVFTVEATGRTTLTANPAAEAMFGYTSDELRNRSTRLLHEDEASYRRFGEESDLSLRHGEPFRGDFTMRRRDGTGFPADITVTLLDPVAGLEGGVVSVIRDLTERVARERQVRFQAALLQQVGQLILAVDEDGRVTYWNEAAELLTGLSRRDVRGKPLIELLIEEEDWETAALAREVVRSGGRWDGEVRLRRGDGGVAIIQTTVTPGPGPDGTSGGRIAAGVDVTSVRRAEEESRRAADRIRLQADMLAAVGEAVIATDLDGRITYWNHAADALYGWSREEALGKPVLEMIPTEEGDDAMAEVFATLREGGTWTGELDLRRRDGSALRARVTDAPLLDEAGTLVGIIGVSSDITGQRQLEEQLRQAQKMEAVGRLAGGIAHDFNNLLTAVEGYASILLDDLPADSPFREDVGQILEAGERAGDLTRQLLAFSRRQVLEERNVDMSSVAVELEKLLRRLVPERIRFRVAATDEFTVVFADRGQLHQVVMNLVVNAVDAIDGDGDITIAVEPVELEDCDTRELPWEVAPGPYVRLSVQDTGSGMSPEVLEHLFEPFFTTKGEGHGTGLGLATAYGIIKQSGGHVLVESEPGSGTTFQVFLPRVAGEADQVRKRPTMASPVEGGVVLLVEDDEAVRNITRKGLVRAGYTVVEAANGREALTLAQGGIDLVISDVVMPDMGGVELQKRLTDQYPNLKVILTSGYSEAEVKGEIRQLGAAFLPKPFTHHALIRCVTEVLGGASQGD